MTTEELKAIQRRARMQPGTRTVGQDTERLCAEVERLQEAVTEARAIIEHVGYISSSRGDVIRLANAWMKENP